LEDYRIEIEDEELIFEEKNDGEAFKRENIISSCEERKNN